MTSLWLLCWVGSFFVVFFFFFFGILRPYKSMHVQCLTTVLETYRLACSFISNSGQSRILTSSSSNFLHPIRAQSVLKHYSTNSGFELHFGFAPNSTWFCGKLSCKKNVHHVNRLGITREMICYDQYIYIFIRSLLYRWFMWYFNLNNFILQCRWCRQTLITL